jgi:hypothetical protein
VSGTKDSGDAMEAPGLSYQNRNPIIYGSQEAKRWDTTEVGHENVSFFCPIFSGAQKSEGCCFQSERLLYGREPHAVRDGTGKAEAAKLQDAGMGPKHCPGNERQKKGTYLTQ